MSNGSDNGSGLSWLEQIIAWLLSLLMIPIPARHLRIRQTGGNMITGVPLGGSGTFNVTPIPANGKLSPAAPTWSTGDASVTLQPSGDGLSCVASVAATETLTTFGLTCSAVSSNGDPLTATVQVPILPAVVIPATGLLIDQIA